jgi:acyl-CoA synthetase (NDP forming)
VGFFSQSGALGTALLQRVAQRGMGISTFVSAGNRADVSGNDLLQYWEEDPATDVILLYLESLGNPRKFTRLARRISREKPVVLVKSGQRSVPTGHAAPVLGLPDSALSSLFDHAGVIRVADLTQLFDVAQLLAYQPLPAGPRVGVVSNSDALALLAVDACVAAGLDPLPPVNLGAQACAEDYGAALPGVLEDVDALVAIYMPPIPCADEDVAAELWRAAEKSGKPVLATFQGRLGMPSALRVRGEGADPGKGSVPSYQAPEEAVRALAHAVRRAQWLRRPAGQVPELDGIDVPAAREIVERALGDRESAEVDAAELLARYGVEVWPAEVVGSPEEAVAAAERTGWPVVVKSAAPGASRRAGTIRLGLGAPEGVREAYIDLAAQLSPDPLPGSGERAGAALAVQRMAPQPAVPTVVSAFEDVDFGSVVSFGLGEVTARLLGDQGYRLAPLTAEDASALVRSVRAAPLLLGEYGYPPVAVGALEELLVRVGLLADEFPEVARLDLDEVLVGESGVTVLGARATLRRPVGYRPDGGPRRLG